MATAQRYLIGTLDDFEVNKMKTVSVGGKSILIARSEDGICAVLNRCSHMPLPLSNGKFDGTTITCPWHGSQYEACTGANTDWVRGVGSVTLPKWSRNLIAMGRQPQGLQTFPIIEEEDGKLYVEA